MKKRKFLVFWNPFEEAPGYPGAEIFSDYVRDHAGVISADLKNNKDPHSVRLLKEADLIVVFLKQNQTCLDTYFSFYHLRQEKILYIIYDYFDSYTPNLEQMILRYRIPRERIVTLPFNNRLALALERGCLSGYLKGEKKVHPYERFTGFFDCFQQAVHKLHRALFFE